MNARDLARGMLVVHYRIEAVLGRGGVGVVYLAEDLRLKRRVALKILATDEGSEAKRPSSSRSGSSSCSGRAGS